MTWLKLSDDFGDDCARARLSDAAFRTHVEGLIWAMRRENDGLLDEIDVRRFAETGDPHKAIQELVNAGWWQRLPQGRLQIVHAMEHQPESDVIERRRKLTAERKRRERRRKAGLQADDETASRRDRTRDPGRGGTGLDGTGSTRRSGSNGSSRATEPKALGGSWPAVRLPGEGWTEAPVGSRVNEY